ncbi:hypothetical protein THIOKS12350078 [Thiocapsa sp. KS1]|nr:hypothetical protein THIOKS12350078 [Thiocapsa sp. KS1]
MFCGSHASPFTTSLGFSPTFIKIDNEPF